MSLKRRDVLSLTGGAAAAASLGFGLRLIELAQARPPGEAAASLQRWGLLIDAKQCDAQWIRKLTVTDEQTGHTQALPVMASTASFRPAWVTRPSCSAT